MFSLGDLEKIHLALDMAQRFVRGESYHGDKPQVLLHDFKGVLQKVSDLRHAETYKLECSHRIESSSIEDAQR